MIFVVPRLNHDHTLTTTPNVKQSELITSKVTQPELAINKIKEPESSRKTLDDQNGCKLRDLYPNNNNESQDFRNHDMYCHVDQNSRHKLTHGHTRDHTQLGAFNQDLPPPGCSSALCRLPTPKPGIFNGDPLECPSWRAAFDTLIIQTGVPYNGRIYYLQKYLGDKALKALAGFMSSATTDSYNNAISLLDDRHGDPFLISGAFRKKLKDWPTVPPL